MQYLYLTSSPPPPSPALELLTFKSAKKMKNTSHVPPNKQGSPAVLESADKGHSVHLCSQGLDAYLVNKVHKERMGFHLVF